MKLRRNNKCFSPLNVIIGKTVWHRSNDVIHNYNYSSDTKLGTVVLDIRIIPWSFHACTTQLSLPLDSKINDACSYPIHWRVYYCNYSLIIGYHNNWIKIKFPDDGTWEVGYEQINRTILDSNVTNM